MPVGWVQHDLLSQVAGLPVYSARNWQWNSSGFYASGGPDDPWGQASPYILIRPKYVRSIKQTVGRRTPLNLWDSARAWSLLAHEVAHSQGSTHAGGFEGGQEYWPITQKTMRRLMTRAGVRPGLQNALVKRARMTIGTVTSTNQPTVPVDTTSPPPIIGP